MGIRLVRDSKANRFCLLVKQNIDLSRESGAVGAWNKGNWHLFLRILN
jgi:hypothetical protein